MTGIKYDDRHNYDMGVWRLHTAWRNRKPGFIPAIGLNMNLRWSVILATFCFGLTGYAGTIQQQSDAPPVQNVAHQDALKDRVSTAPDPGKRLPESPTTVDERPPRVRPEDFSAEREVELPHGARGSRRRATDADPRPPPRCEGTSRSSCSLPLRDRLDLEREPRALGRSDVRSQSRATETEIVGVRRRARRRRGDAVRADPRRENAGGAAWCFLAEPRRVRRAVRWSCGPRYPLSVTVWSHAGRPCRPRAPSTPSRGRTRPSWPGIRPSRGANVDSRRQRAPAAPPGEKSSRAFASFAARDAAHRRMSSSPLARARGPPSGACGRGL